MRFATLVIVAYSTSLGYEEYSLYLFNDTTGISITCIEEPPMKSTLDRFVRLFLHLSPQIQFDEFSADVPRVSG